VEELRPDDSKVRQKSQPDESSGFGLPLALIVISLAAIRNTETGRGLKLKFTFYHPLSYSKKAAAALATRHSGNGFLVLERAQCLKRLLNVIQEQIKTASGSGSCSRLGSNRKYSAAVWWACFKPVQLLSAYERCRTTVGSRRVCIRQSQTAESSWASSRRAS